MNEKTKCFAKGIGTGLIMGSAIGMAMSAGAQDDKKVHKDNMVSKAFRAMGDIVDNIGDAMGM